MSNLEKAELMATMEADILQEVKDLDNKRLNDMAEDAHKIAETMKADSEERGLVLGREYDIISLRALILNNILTDRLLK